MSEQAKRTMDKVLELAYAAGTEALSTEDLRSRKEQCAGVEAEISFSRRILQGKLDILRHARTARQEGDASIATSLVGKLPSILADPSGTKAQLRHVSLDPGGGSEGRRTTEQLGGLVADVDEMSAEQMSTLIEELEKAEAKASEDRRKVHAVIDQIDAELVKRLRT